MKDSYITVFPGKRDQYQLVISLFKNGRLALFISDFYNAGLIPKILTLLRRPHLSAKRYSKELIGAPIFSYPIPNLIHRILSKLIQISKTTVWEDELYARKAVRESRRLKKNLILYEFQAEWAFQQNFNFPIKKILFQFHPHPSWEHPLLLEESKPFPEIYAEVIRNTRNNLSDRYKYHSYSAWKNADHIIVASSITKKSLMVAGCPEEKISLIPYGFSIVDTQLPVELMNKKAEKPFFLFVGSGTFRKGLYRLLESWENTGLAASHDLILISRNMDPNMRALVSKNGVKWIAGVSKVELTWYYNKALCFIMPSLSEGFGQVFLEALANGCPVIGTHYSVLPDISQGENHIILVNPQKNEEIEASLIKVANMEPNDFFFNKESIKKLVDPFTWDNFHQGIEEVLHKLDFSSCKQ